MALMGPKGSVPTPNGWVHPRTGELLKRQKLSHTFIAEWYGDAPAAPMPAPEPMPEPEPVLQTLHEAPVEEEVPVTRSTYNFFSNE